MKFSELMRYPMFTLESKYGDIFTYYPLSRNTYYLEYLDYSSIVEFTLDWIIEGYSIDYIEEQPAPKLLEFNHLGVDEHDIYEAIKYSLYTIRKHHIEPRVIAIGIPSCTCDLTGPNCWLGCRCGANKG